MGPSNSIRGSSQKVASCLNPCADHRGDLGDNRQEPNLDNRRDPGKSGNGRGARLCLDEIRGTKCRRHAHPIPPILSTRQTLRKINVWLAHHHPSALSQANRFPERERERVMRAGGPVSPEVAKGSKFQVSTPSIHLQPQIVYWQHGHKTNRGQLSACFDHGSCVHVPGGVRSLRHRVLYLGSFPSSSARHGSLETERNRHRTSFIV